MATANAPTTSRTDDPTSVATGAMQATGYMPQVQQGTQKDSHHKSEQ